ncbi:Acetyl-coenzyme A ligase [Poriferisphaera corsica]|uniref:Acetyl-coenzyme A synthetase n=1 Tax=Poriferisphaera corsica TaxID=2528020 RepID=A0A517YRG4_9BACT|nr:acetate--CoA ligase [Poriferisphaera corsica]QDU32813.1 Acetyl-coenzyme A ligase [Poriferisphaera corsica]
MTQAKGAAETSSTMESILDEHRHFPPSKVFSNGAHIKSIEQYEAMHKRSIDEPETFWAEIADQLHWFKKWDQVLDWRLPDAKWFVGGSTNICYNCIDRQIDAGLGNHTAIIWESEPLENGQPEVRKLTYYDLRREVSRFANGLKKLGVQKGDVVTIYMPMIPELAIAMLACARIGAVHSIIFGGFSASAIRDRVEDGKSKIVITADGGWRRGKIVPLKDNVDEALTLTDLVETVVVYERCKNNIVMADGRDHWWHEVISTASEHCPAEEMASEDLLFILYTSGSTGKPKGIMHTTGGYMVYTYLTSRYTFDLHETKPDGNGGAENGDVYWCTADIGWITGHSYIIYGLLPNRVPTLMYEGAPDFPEKDRFWDIIERHQVTKFYTAPTAIRAFMKWGREWIDKHDISSLKVLGTVGEPINPEAWMWYHKVIGNEKCPIVDTWWQTETGGHMLTPLPGATTTTPGSCTRPFFGIDAAVVNSEGEEVSTNEGGILVVRKPWPSMLRGIYGNRERFLETYWSKIEGCYTAGDGARKDENGNFWIMGRIDDVIVVAGHNLGTMEVESALVSHEAVAEAAVVGFPHDIKGTGIAAFVTLVGGIEETDELKAQVRNHVAKELGPISKPDKLRFTPALPKTRSGKIMRRLLRDIAAGREITGDITTLEDKSIVEKLQQNSD